MGLPKTWITNELLTSEALNAQFVYVNSLVPVGTILPFDDHNGTVTFDTDIFAYCNGQTISDAASPLNGKVITDMSNRYLVGFGTEAGGDIGTAAWSATIVGTANHTFDFYHRHSETRHTHIENQHRHTETTHVHTLDNDAYALFGHYATGDCRYYQIDVSSWNSNYGFGADTPSDPTISMTKGIVLRGQTNLNSSSNTGYTTPTMQQNDASNTGYALSTTQLIQPRSKQVRFIERYK